MNKSFAAFLSFLIGWGFLIGQTAAPTLPTISWQTWENQIPAKSPQKTLVYIYTDWCTLCKKMDTETFQDTTIARLVNTYFNPVKLDAETKLELRFQGESYNYVRLEKVGYHELAAKLLDGRLGFPSIVFLDENQRVIQSLPSFQNATQLFALLSYFGMNYYRHVPWTTFQRRLIYPNTAEDQ